MGEYSSHGSGVKTSKEQGMVSMLNIDTAAQVFRKLILSRGIKELSNPEKLACRALPRALENGAPDRY